MKKGYLICVGDKLVAYRKRWEDRVEYVVINVETMWNCPDCLFISLGKELDKDTGLVEVVSGLSYNGKEWYCSDGLVSQITLKNGKIIQPRHEEM